MVDANNEFIKSKSTETATEKGGLGSPLPSVTDKALQKSAYSDPKVGADTNKLPSNMEQIEHSGIIPVIRISSSRAGRAEALGDPQDEKMPPPSPAELAKSKAIHDKIRRQHLERARQSEAEGKIDDVEKEYNRLAKFDIDTEGPKGRHVSEDYQRLGNWAEKQNQLQKARDYFQKGAEATPDGPSFQRISRAIQLAEVARVDRRLGHLDDAVKNYHDITNSFDKILEKEKPEDIGPAALRQMSNIYLDAHYANYVKEGEIKPSPATLTLLNKSIQLTATAEQLERIQQQRRPPVPKQLPKEAPARPRPKSRNNLA